MFMAISAIVLSNAYSKSLALLSITIFRQAGTVLSLAGQSFHSQKA
jgi:hypothetical protein